MVICCSAKGCTNRQESSSDIYFHRFPLDKPRILKKWIVALQRENWQPSMNSFLCSNHFSKNCYVVDEHEGGRAHLKDNAVPDTFCFDKPPLKKGRLFKQHGSKNIKKIYGPELKTSNEKCSENKEICETNVEAQAKYTDDYCRLCASQNIQEMFEIFNEEENSYIAEKISRCLPIIVLPSDTLSLCICHSCMKKLNTSYDLIITALKTEELLKTNSLSSDNAQPSDKFQRDSNSKEENIAEQQKLCDGTLDNSEKQVVCKILLEDDGAVKVRRFQKDKCEQRKEDCGECCVEVPNTDSLEKLIKTVSIDLFDDSVLPSISIEGPATCDLCNITFLDMEAFDQHILNFHFVKYKQKCRLCDVGFEESKDLLAHKILKHPYNIKACEKCNLKNNGEHFNETLNNKESKNSEHDYTESFAKVQYDLTCKVCDTIFESKNSFHEHICISEQELNKFHPIPTRIKCVPEEKLLRGENSFLENESKVRNYKNQQFELCSKMKHRKLHIPSNPWEHSCNRCQARFGKLNELMAHIEASHSSKNLNSESESNKSTNKQINWICRFCGKKVSSKLSLTDHETIHTGLKPYICEWCGRKFRSKPNLWQHHLTHTGDRKHKCDICGKKFARKSFVAQHMRVHTGEKPYECNICGQRFTQSGDMRRHWRKHLEVKLNTTYYLDVPTQDKNIFLKVHTTQDLFKKKS